MEELVDGGVVCAGAEGAGCAGAGGSGCAGAWGAGCAGAGGCAAGSGCEAAEVVGCEAAEGAGWGAALGPASGRVAKSSGGGGPEVTAPFFAPTAVTGGTFSTGREDFFAGVPRRSTLTGVVEAPEESGREPG